MMTPIASSLMAPMAGLLTQPVFSPFINSDFEKGVIREGKGQEGEFLLLLAL